MAWKGADSDGVVAMSAAHIEWAQWMRVARNFQLRIGLKDEKREHRTEKFDGFMREVCQEIHFISQASYVALSRITINLLLF